MGVEEIYEEEEMNSTKGVFFFFLKNVNQPNQPTAVKSLLIHLSRLCLGPEHQEGRLPDGENMAKVKFHVIDLSNKDGCHGLIEGGAVHVDGGAHRQDEARHSLIHTNVLLQTVEGDGEGGRAAGRGGGKSVVCFIMSENGLT